MQSAAGTRRGIRRERTVRDGRIGAVEIQRAAVLEGGDIPNKQGIQKVGCRVVVTSHGPAAGGGIAGEDAPVDQRTGLGIGNRSTEAGGGIIEELAGDDLRRSLRVIDRSSADRGMVVDKNTVGDERIRTRTVFDGPALDIREQAIHHHRSGGIIIKSVF